MTAKVKPLNKKQPCGFLFVNSYSYITVANKTLLLYISLSYKIINIYRIKDVFITHSNFSCKTNERV